MEKMGKTVHKAQMGKMYSRKKVRAERERERERKRENERQR